MPAKKQKQLVCPYCGGVNGVEYKWRIEELHSETWSGHDEDNEFLRLIRCNVPRCMDCKRTVTREQIDAIRAGE
jgi:DNA-directed RNA polymerase subunit RPC12/RpoP